jgi:hypothetical protein
MPEKYFSYLLRIWLTDSQEIPTWRVMLEDPHTREVVGFDDLDAFLNHLQNLTGKPAPHQDDQD